MKKLAAVLLVGCVLFTFSACHDDEKIDHPTDGTYHETLDRTEEVRPTDPDWDENTGRLDTLPAPTMPDLVPGRGGTGDVIDPAPGTDPVPGGVPNGDNNPALSGEPVAPSPEP